MSYTVSDGRKLLRALDGKFQDHRHRRVLDLFRLTGVADQQQVYAAAALSRHKFTTLLAHFRRLADDDILAEIPDTGIVSKAAIWEKDRFTLSDEITSTQNAKTSKSGSYRLKTTP